MSAHINFCLMDLFTYEVNPEHTIWIFWNENWWKYVSNLEKHIIMYKAS